MTILKNCEIYFLEIDPDRPSTRMDPDKPKWGLQIRTSSKAVKAEWEAVGIRLKLKEDENGNVFYQTNLNKAAIKRDGTGAKPVSLVDGKLQPIDPRTVGNGSIGNVRIYQYDSEDKTGKKITVSMPMAIQLTKFIKYVPKQRSDFEETETEVIEPVEEEGDDDGGDDQPAPPAPAPRPRPPAPPTPKPPAPKPSAPKAAPAPTAFDDVEDDIPY